MVNRVITHQETVDQFGLELAAVEASSTGEDQLNRNQPKQPGNW